MKTEKKEEYYIKNDRLTDLLADEKSIFVNIETTGFSPAHTQVYLIGCSYRSSNKMILHQFFAEDPSEEREILSAFLELLKPFETIISFNGVGFDIPFLKAKCDYMGMEEHFSDLKYLDIFKSVSDLKPLLNLPNYKQQTLEEYLDIHREDPFSGGELINVYEHFRKENNDHDYHTLILHNYETLMGMLDLLPILAYEEIFHGQYSITETRVDDRTDYGGSTIRELTIKLKNDYPVPKLLTLRKNGYYFQTRDHLTLLKIPVYVGELKFFYPHYEEYYYLPDKDMAIHQSTANFMDEDYRERARPFNCYKRKSGEFLPEITDIIRPVFKKSYEDELCYFELNRDFCSSDVLLRRYTDHILQYLLYSAP